MLPGGRRNYFVVFYGVSGFMADSSPDPVNRACRACWLKSGGPGSEAKYARHALKSNHLEHFSAPGGLGLDLAAGAETVLEMLEEGNNLAK